MRSRAHLAALSAVVVVLSTLACRGSSTGKSITADPAPSCSCSCPPSGTAAAGALPVDLPKAAVEPLPPGESEAMVVVTLDAHGAMTVDGAPAANDSDLEAVAKSTVAHSASVRAVIQADASVTHGKVIHVLDVLRRAGISRIAFGVAPPPP